MTSNIKKMAPLYTVAFFFISLDRFLKTWFYFNKEADYNFGEFISFVYAENRYIAFSIPINPDIIKYISISLTLFIIVVFVNFVINKMNLPAFSLFLIILGSFSNIYDRLKYGFVIDYAYIKHFTIFNIADSLIFVGVAILTYYIYTSTIDKNYLKC